MPELVHFLSLSNPLELCSDHFLGLLCQSGGINEDPTVGLDGARSPLCTFSNELDKPKNLITSDPMPRNVNISPGLIGKNETNKYKVNLQVSFCSAFYTYLSS